jgi:hypothetical protein
MVGYHAHSLLQPSPTIALPGDQATYRGNEGPHRTRLDATARLLKTGRDTTHWDFGELRRDLLLRLRGDIRTQIFAPNTWLRMVQEDDALLSSKESYLMIRNAFGILSCHSHTFHRMGALFRAQRGGRRGTEAVILNAYRNQQAPGTRMTSQHTTSWLK